MSRKVCWIDLITRENRSPGTTRKMSQRLVLFFAQRSTPLRQILKLTKKLTPTLPLIKLSFFHIKEFPLCVNTLNARRVSISCAFFELIISTFASVVRWFLYLSCISLFTDHRKKENLSNWVQLFKVSSSSIRPNLCFNFLRLVHTYVRRKRKHKKKYVRTGETLVLASFSPVPLRFFALSRIYVDPQLRRLVLASSQFTCTLSCAYAYACTYADACTYAQYACVVRVNQPLADE